MKFKNYFALILMLGGSLLVGFVTLGYLITINTDRFNALFSIVLILGAIMLVSGIAYSLVLMIKNRNQE